MIVLALVLNAQLISAFSYYHHHNNYYKRERTTYKFSYFDIKFRGEFIRFILSYSGVQFEDNRVKAEDWPALKPNTPFGQLPVLEVKIGSQVTEISQSQAIG